MISTFDNTVGILVKAYLDGALLKGDCHACAVGNICAAALKQEVKIVVSPRPNMQVPGQAVWLGGYSPNWIDLFATHGNGIQQKMWLRFGHNPEHYPNAYLEIAQTGYTVEQLARIEYAFETAAKGYSEEAEFAGLMAVVDVLADIHGIDLATAEVAKALFVRA